MPSCVPISDIKDTVAFSRKVATAGEPVIVTKNGYEQFVAIDPELFRTYRKETPEECPSQTASPISPRRGR